MKSKHSKSWLLEEHRNKRSPSFRNRTRSRSPILKISRSRSPILKMSRSRSPILKMSRSRSPILKMSRSRSPILKMSRSRSPILKMSRSRSPILKMSRSRSPILKMSRSRSPKLKMSRSRSPKIKMSRSRSPKLKMSRSRSRILKMSRSRSQSLPTSDSSISSFDSYRQVLYSWYSRPRSKSRSPCSDFYKARSRSTSRMKLNSARSKSRSKRSRSRSNESLSSLSSGSRILLRKVFRYTTSHSHKKSRLNFKDILQSKFRTSKQSDSKGSKKWKAISRTRYSSNSSLNESQSSSRSRSRSISKMKLNLTSKSKLKKSSSRSNESQSNFKSKTLSRRSNESRSNFESKTLSSRSNESRSNFESKTLSRKKSRLSAAQGHRKSCINLQNKMKSEIKKRFESKTKFQSKRSPSTSYESYSDSRISRSRSVSRSKSRYSDSESQRKLRLKSKKGPHSELSTKGSNRSRSLSLESISVKTIPEPDSISLHKESSLESLIMLQNNENENELHPILISDDSDCSSPPKSKVKNRESVGNLNHKTAKITVQDEIKTCEEYKKDSVSKMSSQSLSKISKCNFLIPLDEVSALVSNELSTDAFVKLTSKCNLDNTGVNYKRKSPERSSNGVKKYRELKDSNVLVPIDELFAMVSAASPSLETESKASEKKYNYDILKCVTELLNLMDPVKRELGIFQSIIETFITKIKDVPLGNSEYEAFLDILLGLRLIQDKLKVDCLSCPSGDEKNKKKEEIIISIEKLLNNYLLSTINVSCPFALYGLEICEIAQNLQNKSEVEAKAFINTVLLYNGMQYVTDFQISEIYVTTLKFLEMDFNEEI